MRKFITIHPDYSDMLPWTGQETADIVYYDRKQELTRQLVNKGYLLERAWQDKKPVYMIEVKSTTGHSRTPFYMSKRQYQRVSLVRSGILGCELTTSFVQMQENSSTLLSPRGV